MNERKKVKKLLKKSLCQKSAKFNINVNNPKWDFMTYLYYKRNCSNSSTIPINKSNGSIISENDKKELKEDNNKKFNLPYLIPGIKFSNYYYKAPQTDKSLEIKNKIIKSKKEQLSEKRSRENVNKTLNEFGIRRARLKENINNKYEIKSLITTYVNQNKEELNFTSPSLKKYLIKKRKILSKPIKREKDLDYNKFRNYSANNIFEKDKININQTIFNNISYLPRNTKQFENIEENKKEKIAINTYLHSKYVHHKLDNNYKLNKINNEGFRLLYGINHIKIYMDNIQNINKDSNLIEGQDKGNEINIKLKISEKISKNSIKDNFNKNNLGMDISTQIFTSEALLNQKIQYFHSLDKIKDKNKDIYKYLYKEEINCIVDDINNRRNIHLSAFDLKNLEKMKNVKNESNFFEKKNVKSFDPNEKKLIEINNNYELYKKNLLLMRKNFVFLKKREFEQLRNKIRNINFKYNNRYDNIDEDKDEFEFKTKDYDSEKNKKKGNIIRENNYNDINKKNERQQKENSLLNSIINPNDNFGYFIYYFPRPESSLMIRKKIY